MNWVLILLVEILVYVAGPRKELPAADVSVSGGSSARSASAIRSHSRRHPLLNQILRNLGGHLFTIILLRITII